MAQNLCRSVGNIKIIRFYSALPKENLPVIKIPTYVTKYVAKQKELREKRRMDVLKKTIYRGDTRYPVISCNVKEYNFYRGQVYNPKYPIPVVSKYWMKQKSAGQKFTIEPWDENPALPLDLQIPDEILQISNERDMATVITEFHQMKLSPVVLEAIKALGFERPTPIQAKAIPKIQGDDHVLLVSQSGSGKTMSYLIPIINNLMKCREKQQRYPNTPLALIICPGRELAEQIALAAYRLGLLCSVSVKLAIPGGTTNVFLRPNNQDPIDVLVATFGTIYQLSMNRVMNLSHLKHLVFDEADTLLDDSFLRQREKFMRRIFTRDTIYDQKMKQHGAQIIFSSATTPDVSCIFDEFNLDGEALQKAASPLIHTVPPHVRQKFIRVNHENKLAHLLELVDKDYKKKSPVMIFCNSTPSCNFVSHVLREKDVLHVRFHAGLKYEEREDAFHRFQSGDVDVFCCTDLASRGLDTQRVKHVINFDFPNSVSDYLLRVGRVGRIGSNEGYVTNLIVSKSNVYVVQDIEVSVRMSRRIQNVDANIKKKLVKLYGPEMS